MTDRINRPEKLYALRLCALSLVGLVATFWQTTEKIHLLMYPDTPLSCDLNPIVDCGTVLSHSYSAIFGFPNSLAGLVVFAILLGIGIVLLSGIRANAHVRHLLLGLGATIFAFSLWFFAVSVFEINKICIFCVAIWASVVPLYVLTLSQFSETAFAKSKKEGALKKVVKAYPFRVIITLYVIGLTVFLFRFRDYYFG